METDLRHGTLEQKKEILLAEFDQKYKTIRRKRRCLSNGWLPLMRDVSQEVIGGWNQVNWSDRHHNQERLDVGK